jgi:hypothetical protein
VTDKGPRTINWVNVKRDSSILEQFQQEYISSKQSVAQFLYLKFKNEPDKLEVAAVDWIGNVVEIVVPLSVNELFTSWPLPESHFVIRLLVNEPAFFNATV